MKEAGFEFIDISGDAGVRAFGNTFDEVFAHTAKGMYKLVTDVEKLEIEKSIRITLESHSLESLLVKWLNELIFHIDTDGFIGKEIRIISLDTDSDTKSIDSVMAGGKLNQSRHEVGLLLKAATYHKLKLYERDGLLFAEVIFDI